MKIMAVDDSNTMLNLVNKTLNDMGYTDVVLCESGDIALEKLEEQKVDLILLDWHMPGITGLDFIRIVKNGENTKDIPIVMLTTETHPLSIVEARDSGADAYMIKPINSNAFTNIVNKLAKKYNLQ